MKFQPGILCAITLCVGIAHAQDTAPAVTPPPAAVAPAPIQFSVKLTPGATRAYKITVDQKGNLSIPGSGQAMPFEAKVTAYAKLMVDKQNADGSYAVRYRIGGLKITSNSPMPLPPTQESFDIKGTVLKDGTFVPDASSADKASPAGMMSSPQQSMTSVFQSLSVIPPKAVALGETWSTSVPVPFDSTGKSVVTVQSKVLSVDTVKGDQIARIQRSMQGPINMALTQPMPVTVSGTMAGSGTSKANVGTGEALQDDSKVHLSLNITVPNQAGNGDQQSMGLEMDITSKVESGVVEPKAKAK